MTLVASLFFERLPVGIGDVLVSAMKLGGIHVHLPTIDPSLLKLDERAPRSLVQKLVVCGDNIAFGWSGARKVAEEVISELMRHQKTECFDRYSFLSFLDRLPYDVRQQIAIVGMAHDQNRMYPFMFGERASALKTTLFGNVCMAGSGCDILTRELHFLDLKSLIADVETTDGHRALAVTVGFIGKLLLEELLTGKTLNALFGGGYEIAGWMGQRFAKLEDVTYLFWSAKTYKDGKIEVSKFPFRGFKYSCQEDLLLIQTFDTTESPSRPSVEYFFISPIYREYHPSEVRIPARPSFDAPILCNLVFVEAESGETSALSFVHFVPRGHEWIKFRYEESRFILSVHDNFYRMISEKVSSRYPC